MNDDGPTPDPDPRFADYEWPEDLCHICAEWIGQVVTTPGVIGRHNQPGSWRYVSPGVRKPKVCKGVGQVPEITRYPRPGALASQ